MTLRPDVYAGSSVKVAVYFEDPETGLPAAITEPVIIRVRPPAAGPLPAIILSLPASPAGAGRYEATFVATDPGRYVIRGNSSGTTPAVAWDELEVRSSFV